MHETPAMFKATYTPNTYGPTNIGPDEFMRRYNEEKRAKRYDESMHEVGFGPATLKSEEDDMPKSDPRRMVRVVIVDPDKRIPVDSALLYDSGDIITDSTDQELFFESGVNAKLQHHNHNVREKTIDKDASRRAGQDVYLEPIRIRDLQMTVVELALF